MGKAHWADKEIDVGVTTVAVVGGIWSWIGADVDVEGRHGVD